MTISAAYLSCFAGQRTGAKVPRLQTAPLSVDVRSFRRILGRAIIAWSGPEACRCFLLERARAERPRGSDHRRADPRFFVAEHVCRSSGILSCVFCGLVLARFAPPILTQPHTIHTVWATLEYCANTLIFLLSGVLALQAILRHLREGTGELLGRELPLALFVYAMLNVVRAAMVACLWPLISRFEDPHDRGVGKFLDRRAAAVIAWGGLRGAISLALAIVVTHDVEGKRGAQLLFHVACQTFLTLAINGSTAGGRSARNSTGPLW